MNPDIQRIAEKWLDDFLGDCRLTFGMDETEKCLLLERFQEALTELSALRDTQERELRHSIWQKDKAIQLLQEIIDEAVEEAKKNLCGATFETANGETVSPCHLPVNHTGDHCGKCLGSDVRWPRGFMSEYELHLSEIASQDLRAELASLRAELARRDEVEKRLNDESNGLKEQIINQVTVIKSLRSRIGELEAKYGVQEQLDHIFGQLPSNEDT